MKKEKYQRLKDEKFNNYDFEKTLAKFNVDEPFYGHISANINKYKTDKLDTAGVFVKNGKMILLYNEEFFNSLNWQEKQGLLIHEFMHLIFLHATSRTKKDKDGNPDKAWFVACDFAINSLIDEDRLPPGGLIPGKWNEVPAEHRHLYSEDMLNAMDEFRDMVRSWPKKMSADWYYEQINLKREVFDKLNQDNHISLIDDHGGWDELSQEEKEIIESNFERIIKEAADICNRSRHWGSVSQELQSSIESLLKNEIDWVDILRHFIGNSLTSHFNSTIKKINKRYPYIHPGRKRQRTSRVAICIDQSGSVDDASLSLFFAELSNLSDITEFIVIPFDSKVIEDAIFTWEKGEKIAPKRAARGGTDFDVPTEWINENSSKFDAVVFMTDGLCSKPISCKIPRCWIICPNSDLIFETNELKIIMQNT